MKAKKREFLRANETCKDWKPERREHFCERRRNMREEEKFEEKRPQNDICGETAPQRRVSLRGRKTSEKMMPAGNTACEKRKPARREHLNEEGT